MQRFALLHDGSLQSWQAVYLAFHIAARLGAPLQAFLINDSYDDKETLDQRAAHVEIGGRAAAVSIETHLLTDSSPDGLHEYITEFDGLFVANRLMPDGKSVARFLKALSCPLWIVSKGQEIQATAVLVSDLTKEREVISYAKSLSNRLQQPLTGLVQKNELDSTPQSGLPPLKWVALPALSPADVASMIGRFDIDLLFMSALNAFMVSELPCNCVVRPEVQDT